METSTRHRVLLLVDERFRGSDLAEELKVDGGWQPESVEIFVISPAYAHSALDQELGNIAESRPEAEDRLGETLEQLRDAGFSARGEVGDSEPMVAIGDGLREFNADEIVVVRHVDSEIEHAERDFLGRLRTDFHQPVTELLVKHPEGGLPSISGVEHAPAHEKTEEEIIRETRNFPPLKKRDIAGILIGFIGTVALGMIAVAAGTDADGDFTGRSAAILLIAIGAFLINVAHIVGLLLFESVRYTGIWEKFMSRMSVWVTGVGLVAALILWLA